MRTRFRVAGVFPDGKDRSAVTLYPMQITPDKRENEIFNTAVAGSIVLSFNAKDAADQFKVGEEWFIDLAPVNAAGGAPARAPSAAPRQP